MFSSVLTLFIITEEQWKHIFPSVGQIVLGLLQSWKLELLIAEMSELLIAENNTNIHFHCFEGAAVTPVSQSFSSHIQFIVQLALSVLAGYLFEFLLCCIPHMFWVLLDHWRLTGHAGKLLTNISWPRKWSSYTVHEKSCVLELPICLRRILVCILEGNNSSKIFLTMDLHVFLYP